GQRRLLKIPAEPSPELRIPNAAAQTRIVSKARIRLDSRKSVRSFKGIICVDISEFESYMPSHAVGSLWRVYPVHLRRADGVASVPLCTALQTAWLYGYDVGRELC